MKKRQHLNNVKELEMVLRKKNLLGRFGIHRLGVFGSFARNEPANDIDLLIEDDLSLEKALQFKTELESIVDNSLDIMIKRWANPIVLCRGEKDMVYVEG